MDDQNFALHLDTHRPELEEVCDNAEERAVAKALRWGQENAIQIKELAAITGVAPRDVQTIVSHLVLDHRYPIGTSMGKQPGNYLIDSAEDFDHTVNLLKTRGISNLRRAAALRRISVDDYLRLIQNELQLENRRN